MAGILTGSFSGTDQAICGEEYLKSAEDWNPIMVFFVMFHYFSEIWMIISKFQKPFEWEMWVSLVTPFPKDKNKNRTNGETWQLCLHFSRILSDKSVGSNSRKPQKGLLGPKKPKMPQIPASPIFFSNRNKLTGPPNFYGCLWLFVVVNCCSWLLIAVHGC